MVLILMASAASCFSMNEVHPLTKEGAGKASITVKSRANGEAGIKVWLEIDKKGLLGDFAWIELRMNDEEGQLLLSTRLQPHPITPGQSKDTVTVSFSADPSQLRNYSFWIFKGGGLLDGRVFTLRISDFLKVPGEPSL